MDYRQLLADTDAEARDEYNYDPRVALQETADANGENVVPQQPKQTAVDDAQATIEQLGDPQFNSTLTLPVQNAPSMVPRKRNIIIDSAQRDWTIQPDAYSNIFSFGTQVPAQTVGPQTPFYFNNPTIPLSAWETPLTPRTVGSGAHSTSVAVPNNNPQRFPPGVIVPSYINTTNQGLVYPSYGWKIVLSNNQIVHSPTPVNYSDPATKVFFYPVYDPAQTAGAQIGIDIQQKQYGTSSYTYSTQLALSNICEIKLCRAILPVRGTQPYLSTAFSSGSNIEYPVSFHNQPYLLMTIQNLKGCYLGGSQIVQQAFTVLTQNTRNFYEGNVSYQCQYSDFHPWGQESYIFDPPMSKLSNANIQLFSPAGNVFSQLDNLNIIDFALDTQNIGKVKFFVSQAISNTTFGDCNAFLRTDVRVGDEITFYSPALAQISADPSCTPFLTAFMAIMSNNFIVTDICGTDFAVPHIFPTISSIGTSFTAVPKVAGYAGMSNAVTTICGLLNTLSQVCLQQYGGVPAGPLSFAGRRSLAQDYVIPMMNVNTQATFVLEVTTLEPDTTNIQKIIPN
jgi:hypothetical protein